jgi:Na+/H+ antiporter NhaD/arsenite permease-like protein
MILSAQLRLGGFYTWLALRVTGWIDRPALFLFALMLVSGLLSALLANDIICLAFTPVLAVALRRRRLNPVPFLLGLAMATNLGSASTMIGNPQSMLIGQLGDLSFRGFLFWCAPPSLVCLFCTYGLLLLLFRKRMTAAVSHDPFSEPDWPEFSPWQSAKGLIAVAVVVVLLLLNLPRELTVLTVAGALLLSRRMHTRSILGLVDWHLITLFCGLFIVVRGLNHTGVPAQALAWLGDHGLSLAHPFTLGVSAVLLSNVVSNVPATVLISPHLPADQPLLWYVLSLGTTYAGNLLTIGSMANLIVIEQARPFGIRLSFREYARAGVPVTAMNLLILGLWILIRTPG